MAAFSLKSLQWRLVVRAWVVNKEQRRDKGIDGRGFLLNKTTEGKDLVVAQVTTSKPPMDKVKAFAQTIRSNEAAAGVFITPAAKG